MKRLTALLLVLLLALALCACNTSDNKDSKDSKDEPKTENTDSKTNDNSDDASDDDIVEFTRGTVTNNVYESEYMGIGIRFDDTWTFSSDEELKELVGIAADLSGDELKKAWVEANAVTDMMAINPMSYNVIITFEKNLPSVLETVSMDTIINNAISSVKATYENMGVTDIETERTTISVEGESLDAVRIKVNYMGIDLYQSMILKKCSGHIASIAITSTGEDVMDDIVANMFLVK